MEQGSSSTKNLIIAGVALLLIVGGGYFYTTRDQSSDLNLLVGVPVGGSQPIDGDLLSTLRELKRLRLDETIFTDGSFMTLTDQSKPLPPQTSGRANPFAPLDLSTAFSSSTPAR